MSSVRPPGAGYLYLAACDAPDLAQLSMHVRDLTATSLHRRDNVARAKLHAIAAAHALSPSPPPPRRTPKPTRVCHDRHVDNDDDASTKDEAQSVQEEPASTSPSQKRIDALTRRLSQLLPSPGLSIVANSKAAAEVPRTPETSARELSEDGTFRPFLESIPPSPSLVELQTPLASPHKLLHRRNEPSLSASPAPRSLPPSPAAGAKSAQQDSVVSTLSVEIDVLSPTFASKRMQPELQAIKAGATAFQFISTRVDARVDSPPEFVASKLSLPYLLPPRLDREATLQGTNTSTMVMSLALAASSAGGVSAAVSSPTAPRSRTSPGTSFTASASPRVRRSAIVGASPVSVPTMVPVPSPLPPPPPPDTMASIAKRIATSAAEAAALTEKKAQIAPCLFDATSGSNAAARESYQDIVEIKMFNAGVHAVHDAATLATVARFLRACELHLDAPSAERQTVMVCYCPFASNVALRSCASLLAAALLLVNGAPATLTPISANPEKDGRGKQLVTLTEDQAALAVQPFGISLIGATAAHNAMKDALAALARSLRMHYFSFATFDADAFDFHSLPANGRAFVIVPNRLVIFASPVAANRRPDVAAAGQYADAMRLVPVLCEQRTRLIVRLCTCEYDTRIFARAIPDLAEINVFFPEECSPPLYAFAEMVEIIASPFHQHRGAIAVQSKNNMGRAPLFAALLLMQDWEMTPSEACAWIRLHSPDAISESQRTFLAAVAPILAHERCHTSQRDLSFAREFRVSATTVALAFHRQNQRIVGSPVDASNTAVPSAFTPAMVACELGEYDGDIGTEVADTPSSSRPISLRNANTSATSSPKRPVLRRCQRIGSMSVASASAPSSPIKCGGAIAFERDANSARASAGGFGQKHGAGISNHGRDSLIAAISEISGDGAVGRTNAGIERSGSQDSMNEAINGIHARESDSRPRHGNINAVFDAQGVQQQEPGAFSVDELEMNFRRNGQIDPGLLFAETRIRAATQAALAAAETLERDILAPRMPPMLASTRRSCSLILPRTGGNLASPPRTPGSLQVVMDAVRIPSTLTQAVAPSLNSLSKSFSRSASMGAGSGARDAYGSAIAVDAHDHRGLGNDHDTRSSINSRSIASNLCIPPWTPAPAQ